MSPTLVLLAGGLALMIVSGQAAVPWNCNVCPVGACVNNPSCPATDDPFNPTMLPHTNCNQFYKCSHGQACEYTCPAGLHFSRPLKRCEWPHIACCDPTVECAPGCPEVCPPPPPPPTTTTTAPATTTTTTAAPVTVTPPPLTTLPDTPCLPCLPQCIPDARCPPADNPLEPTLLPHESDCAQFYKCAFGERCPMRCPPGEHFSSDLQRCEWPQYACCDGTTPCEQLPTPGDPCSPVPCPVLDCRPDNGCPVGDDLLNPLLLPVPGSCRAFYKCRAGDACLMECPAGQHFSQSLQRCERPEVACCDPAVTCCAACVASRRHALNRLFGVRTYR